MSEVQANCIEMALHATETDQDVFEQFVRAAKAMGFEYFAYGVRAPVPVSRPAIGMFNNYPLAWRTRYIASRYVALDPTVRHALHSSEPIIWAGEVTREEPDFWEEARSFGLGHGWTLACRDHNGTVALVSFARCAERISEAELEAKSAALMWTAHVAHATLVKRWLPKHVPEAGEHITTREQEVLRWTAEGKTSYEIARIMSISERTVNFHIRNITAKLRATNKTQAAVKAAMLGMLF